MAKSKSTIFFCSSCGFESAKWMGQCPGCREWNTFVEEVVPPKSSGRASSAPISRSDLPVPVAVPDVKADDSVRFETGFGELDRVLGGGIVRGSLILVGGDPGIGKSTLLLQVARYVSSKGEPVLYVSGEESMQQIKLRADRIGDFSENMKLLCDTDLDVISQVVTTSKPGCVIIDSVQTMVDSQLSSAPGSVTQIRSATSTFMKLAKSMGVTIFLVGHVTKEGVVAGPRILEHMVDTVLYFEGDRHAAYRIIRGVKNRFGSTDEIGVFEMESEGLREVENPSAFLIGGRCTDASGSCVTCTIEGTRPLLLEVQSLSSTSRFGNPRRAATGTDSGRVNLLIAVLEKRAGINLSDSDVYVNIAGGMKVQEPAMDLCVALCIASGFLDFVIDPGTICFGEIGLSGEIRSVSLALARLKEAARLGFTRALVPAGNAASIEKIEGLEIVAVGDINEALRAVR
ncbi:MAG: DNA repair protein RadA [Eubacterium sp.]|nr:DNA repair protein RadA [Eubacterium sp.]